MQIKFNFMVSEYCEIKSYIVKFSSNMVYMCKMSWERSPTTQQSDYFSVVILKIMNITCFKSCSYVLNLSVSCYNHQP